MLWLQLTLKYLFLAKSVLGVQWKDWCWSWNSNTLATDAELTHLKRPWCWERLRVGGEGDDRGWDSWMASLTQWPWVLVDSGSWWWTAMPGVLQFMGSQRVRHDWVTEMNWTEITVDRISENLFFLFWFTNKIIIAFCYKPKHLFLNFFILLNSQIWLHLKINILYQLLVTKHKFYDTHYKVFSAIGSIFK